MGKLLQIFKLALHPKNWKSLYKDNKEVCNYVIFGVGTTIVSFVTYYITRWIFPSSESVPDFLKWIFNITGALGTESNTALPVIVSWICSVTFAYLTNRKWVFESKATGFVKITKEVVLFYAARILTLFVDMLIMFLLVDLTAITNGIYEFCAKVASNIVVLVLNYILSKLIVFKKKKKVE